MAAARPELTVDAPIRLSAGSLAALASDVERPRYDRDATGVGQVHLGVGAFMRAHTAVYTDDAIAAAGGDWAIAGVSLRHRTVSEQLVPQDCLYTVRVRDNASVSCRLMGALRSVDVAPDDPQRIVRLLADPAVRIVTITVTEKGYALRPDTGELDTGNADVAHDLAEPDAPRTMLGCLVAGMRRRRNSGAPPFTVISCDNLPANGRRLERATAAFTELACPDLDAWIAANVAFPSTMVDRIVPATTAADVEAVAADIGVLDLAHVKTEPFSQWVIEDRFANERPAWEAGGALFVADVEAYETAKLRLLNGPHSALAYLGYLAGCEYIHEAMQRPEFAAFARLVMTREISPVTPEPDGMAHGAYIDRLLGRFANASLGHRTWQIAMDGSQKLPQRLLNTIRTQLRRGGPIAGLALAVAAWMRYATGRDEKGDAIDVRDPLAARFAAIAADAPGGAEDIVRRFFALGEVFGRDLGGNPRFVATVTAALDTLLTRGAAAAVHEYVEGCGKS